MSQIILGSKSPRRVELLKLLGFEFEQVNFEVEEIWPDNLPTEHIAIFLAELKAKTYSSLLKPNQLLITADSVVIHQDKILGKPQSDEQAREYLTYLSNDQHTVTTGVCLSTTKKVIFFDESAIVHCDPISSQEIDFYIKNYRPFDKAGAYGIQEWLGLAKVRKIEGTYSNIMGLPTASLYHHIVKFFPEYLPGKI